MKAPKIGAFRQFVGADTLISELFPKELPGSPKSQQLFGEEEEQGSGRMFSPIGGNEVKRTLLRRGGGDESQCGHKARI